MYVQVALCRRFDPVNADQYEAVSASELSDEAFFGELKLPQSMLSRFELRNAVPLSVRMKWVYLVNSRNRRLERIAEVPAEIRDACRYYQEREIVLNAAARDAVAGPSHLHCMRTTGELDLPVTAAVRSILLRERANTLDLWRELHVVAVQHFPPGEAEPFSAPPAAGRDEVVNPSTSSEPTEDADAQADEDAQADADDGDESDSTDGMD
jgi:hypothetical protein